MHDWCGLVLYNTCLETRKHVDSRSGSTLYNLRTCNRGREREIHVISQLSDWIRSEPMIPPTDEQAGQ